MTIEGIGPVDPIQRFNKTERIHKPDATRTGDSISVSDEAKLRSEIMQAVAEIREMPDLRMDRVAEVKARLEDPSYIDDRIVEAVADEIMSVFDIT
jgi:negative regulator of flagellin synthesis FlgM